MAGHLGEQQIRSLANFLGYGNPSAGLWFVGLEEGLGGKMSDADRRHNLSVRATWGQFENLRLAHLQLKERGAPIQDLIDRSGSTQVWRFMARIARGFEGEVDAMCSERAAAYVQTRLGQDGGTFLTELDPFPAKTARQPIELAGFPDQDLLKALRIQRRERQLALLAAGPHKKVICYGGRHAEAFSEHFGFRWQPLATYEWTSKRGTRMLTNISWASLCVGGRVVGDAFMLPFLGNGQMSEQLLNQFVRNERFVRTD